MPEATLDFVFKVLALVLLPGVAWLFKKITTLERNVALLNQIVEEREKARQAAERLRDERMKELLDRVKELQKDVMVAIKG